MMARAGSDKVSDLTDLQLAVMRALWSLGPATMSEVHAELSLERDLARTTVGTLLSRLRKQGLVSTTERGRQLIYSARVSQAQVVRSTMRRIQARLFGGDSVALVQHLLTSGSIRQGDARRIRELIAAAAEGERE